VLQALTHVNRTLGTTVAVITHNAAIADMADRVVRMRSGSISGITRNEHPLAPTELTW
jgi:putative ABC transport system ATP-binding protein